MLAQDVAPEETKHKLRCLFGNGLRPQIWKTFTTRFNIPHIIEFYGKYKDKILIIEIINHYGMLYISDTLKIIIIALRCHGRKL